MPKDNDWSRPEAEKRPKELLDAAKEAFQTVQDFDGHFEVRFIKPTLTTIAEILARGNPLAEDEGNQECN